MTDKPKMSLVPPKTKSADKLKAFIEEPEKKIQEEGQGKEERSPGQDKTDQENEEVNEALYPWEEPGIIREIIKPVTLRMELPTKVKATYIVKNSLKYRSLHQFLIEAILEKINSELEEMIGK